MSTVMDEIKKEQKTPTPVNDMAISGYDSKLMQRMLGVIGSVPLPDEVVRLYKQVRQYHINADMGMGLPESDMAMILLLAVENERKAEVFVEQPTDWAAIERGAPVRVNQKDKTFEGFYRGKAEFGRLKVANADSGSETNHPSDKVTLLDKLTKTPEG